jgi:hypothetical protein
VCSLIFSSKAVFAAAAAAWRRVTGIAIWRKKMLRRDGTFVRTKEGWGGGGVERSDLVPRRNPREGSFIRQRFRLQISTRHLHFSRIRWLLQERNALTTKILPAKMLYQTNRRKQSKSVWWAPPCARTDNLSEKKSNRW